MLVLFSGCIVDEAKTSTLPASSTITSSEPTTLEKTSSTTGTATSTVRDAEIEKVMDYSDEFMKSESLRSIARERGDESVCELIPQAFSRNGCFRDIALAKKDAVICEIIGDSDVVDGCLMTLALQTADHSVCQQITSENTKYKCLAQTQGNHHWCEQIKDVKSRDFCVYSLMKKLGDAGVCESIISVDVRDKCYLDYVKADRMNSALCNMIVDETLYSECNGVAVKLSCEIENFNPKYGKPLEPRRVVK